MPLQATSGAASYDGFGGGVVAEPNYIESCFSTWLYTGTGATQTITNGIDLSTKGGLVWLKSRTTAYNNNLFDTARGVNNRLFSNTTAAQTTTADSLTAFNTNGFSLGSGSAGINDSADSMVSWTFREQPKFFDVVTYTGNGASGRTISHNLGSVPGCIIVKRTDTTGAWAVYHRSVTDTDYKVLTLNNTDAVSTPGDEFWSISNITSTTFGVGTAARTNASGGTYVAYLFAHNAGGFGLTGTDNVISCGSFTTDGSGNASVNLGYEPQFWLYKPNLNARYWQIYDTMRGWSQTQIANLAPNRSDAEGGGAATAFYPTATGFDCVGGNLDASTQHIYIAIRRGPMKVPTVGTSVFYPLARTGTNAAATITGVGFPPDLVIGKVRDGTFRPGFMDRLRGTGVALQSSVTDAEVGTTVAVTAFGQDGVSVGADSDIAFINYLTNLYASWFFKRAPSFFDEVCYTGDGTTPQNIIHNLSVAPEMMIIKCRSNASTSWVCYHKGVNGGVTPQNYYMLLQSDQAQVALTTIFNDTAPTSSVFTVGAQGSVGLSGRTQVAYLFATCANVSKVGSYTGNGSSQTINCGFTGGARFVMVKATSTTGNWIVADSARGIVAGNDPALYLNSTAAEVTGLDWIDADNSGFVVNETATIAANTNGVSYIFLAVA